MDLLGICIFETLLSFSFVNSNVRELTVETYRGPCGADLQLDVCMMCMLLCITCMYDVYISSRNIYCYYNK